MKNPKTTLVSDELKAAMREFWARWEARELRIRLLREFAERRVKSHVSAGLVRAEFQRRVKFRVRQKEPCWCCFDRPAAHRHHIVAIANGGTNAGANLISLCKVCHERVHPWMQAPVVALPEDLVKPIWWTP